MQFVHGPMELHVDRDLVIRLAIGAFVGNFVMRHREAVLDLDDAVGFLAEESTNDTSLQDVE